MPAVIRLSRREAAASLGGSGRAGVIEAMRVVDGADCAVNRNRGGAEACCSNAESAADGTGCCCVERCGLLLPTVSSGPMRLSGSSNGDWGALLPGTIPAVFTACRATPNPGPLAGGIAQSSALALLEPSGPAAGWLERVLASRRLQCSGETTAAAPPIGTCSLCVPLTGGDDVWLDDATATDGQKTRPGGSGSSVVLEFDRG